MMQPGQFAEGVTLEQNTDEGEEPNEMSSVELSADEDEDSNLGEERELYQEKAKFSADAQDKVMRATGFYDAQQLIKKGEESAVMGMAAGTPHEEVKMGEMPQVMAPSGQVVANFGVAPGLPAQFMSPFYGQ